MDEIIIGEWGTTEVLVPTPEAELFALDGPDQELIFVGDVGIQGPPGAQGEVGPQGPAGPTGPAGADADKTFSQSFSGTNVTVTHNLGKYPAVTVFTSAGDEIEADIEHLSANQLQVLLSFSISGSVVCN